MKKKQEQPVTPPRVSRATFDPEQFRTVPSTGPRITAAPAYYGRDGEETDSETDAAAKLVGGRCYVRFSTGGINANQMWDAMKFPDVDFKKQNRSVGQAQYEFRLVSELSLQTYLKFLAGRNPADLRNAERFA